MFSRPTVDLLNELLASYQLPANHPQFDSLASTISVAKVELGAYYATQNPSKEVAPAPSAEETPDAAKDPS